MKTIPHSIVLTALSILLLSSCATQYHGLQPVSPKPLGVGVSADLATVDSLQPTLSWKSEGSSDTKFDIILYTGVAKSVNKVLFGLADSGQYYYVQGVEVYYREGIEGFSHHIEQPLEPKTVYVWAVRTHSGTNIGPWSTYDFQRGLIPVKHLAESEGQNLWWSFRTPKR